jgi:ArsR family transcriptional regulator
MRGRCQHISLELPRGKQRGSPAEAEASADDQSAGVVAPDAAPSGETDDGTDVNSVAEDGPGDGVADLAEEYAYLEDVERELSLAQRWVHGRVTDILDTLSERLGSEADSRFHAEVLAAIARGARSARDIAGELNADPERVETALDRLSDQELIEHDGQEWTIQ